MVRATIRVTAGITIVLYLLVVALLALTVAFPHWGESPHQVGPPGNDFWFYVPPQAIAAVYTGLFAVGLATLLGVLCVVRSRAVRRATWATSFTWLTVAAVQGPILIAAMIYVFHGSPNPTLEVVSVLASLLAYLVLPVLALVSLRHLATGRP
jgi:hypothetical protein